MIINYYLTEFVLSCVFRKVIYREQQDSPFFLLYSRQNAEKLQEEVKNSHGRSMLATKGMQE
jgi:hypothetical protein